MRHTLIPQVLCDTTRRNATQRNATQQQQLTQDGEEGKGRNSAQVEAPRARPDDFFDVMCSGGMSNPMPDADEKDDGGCLPA